MTRQQRRARERQARRRARRDGGIFTYAPDGTRERFDPRRVPFDGCLLCGRPVVMVGVFVPADDAMHNAVMTLRRHPVRPMSAPGLAYGLCREHAADPEESIGLVEARLEQLAARVVVQ